MDCCAKHQFSFLLVATAVACYIMTSVKYSQPAESIPEIRNRDFAVNKQSSTWVKTEDLAARKGKAVRESTERYKVEDTTLYVHNSTNISMLDQFSQGVIFWNYHGGFANQAYSFASSIILADVLKVPFFYVDKTLDEAFIIKRPSGLPVISITEDVIDILKKKGSALYQCFTYDRDLDYHNYMKFRVMVNQIRAKRIRESIPPANFIIMDSNCPLFHYWSANYDNCVEIRQLGYLPEEFDCTRHSFKDISLLLQFMFNHVVMFRDVVIDRIEEVLSPFKNALISNTATTPRMKYPFRKYSNLFSVHARYGNGGADFKDSRTFLSLRRNHTFIDCIRAHDEHHSSFIYLATDSSAMKKEFEREFGDRLITLKGPICHSAFDMNRGNCSATLSTVVDFVILTMGQNFVGTARSSFSSMAEFVGNLPTIRVSQSASTCTPMRTYLPS